MTLASSPLNSIVNILTGSFDFDELLCDLAFFRLDHCPACYTEIPIKPCPVSWNDPQHPPCYNIQVCHRPPPYVSTPT